MYNPTAVDGETLRIAAREAAKLYEDSLVRQFIDVDPPGNVLRPSRLGKPAVDMFAERFYPELYVDRVAAFTLQQQELFHQGDVFEADLYFHLIRSGAKVIRVQPEINWNGITGHGDFTVDLGNGEMLVEAKSAKDSFFKQCMKKSIDDERAYQTQLAIYADALNLPCAWCIFNKDNAAVTWIYPAQEDLDWSLARATRIKHAWDTCDSFDDIFEFLRPPPPKKEFNGGRWTGKYLIPLCMYGSPAIDLVYDHEIGRNAKDEPRHYVYDYVYPAKWEHLKPELEQK